MYNKRLSEHAAVNRRVVGSSPTIGANINSIELPKADAYNIMVCISRMVEDAGSRYIYISIGDAIHDKVYK